MLVCLSISLIRLSGYVRLRRARVAQDSPGSSRYSPQRLLHAWLITVATFGVQVQCSVRALFSSLKIRARGLATAMAAMAGGSTKRAIVEIISDVV